ncbi:MAG: hypothetical protein Q7S95_03435 [bacterium]|nr:hypothetical protein [bacterium]
MMRFLLVGALVALVAYGLVEAHALLSGPTLVVDAPTDGGQYPDGLVTIQGATRYGVSLMLDGATLLPTAAGRFETVLAFPSGSSILTLVATDRFGRSVTKTRTIYVPAMNSQPPTNN